MRTSRGTSIDTTASSFLPIESSASFERLGLRERPREAVEHEAVVAVGLRQPVLDHGDDHGVRNELCPASM